MHSGGKHAGHAQPIEHGGDEEGQEAQHADSEARAAAAHACLALEAGGVEVPANHVDGACYRGEDGVEGSVQQQERDDACLLLEVVACGALGSVERHPVLKGELGSESSQPWVGMAAVADAGAGQLLKLVILRGGTSQVTSITIPIQETRKRNRSDLLERRHQQFCMHHRRLPARKQTSRFLRFRWCSSWQAIPAS